VESRPSMQNEANVEGKCNIRLEYVRLFETCMTHTSLLSALQPN